MIFSSLDLFPKHLTKHQAQLRFYASSVLGAESLLRAELQEAGFVCHLSGPGGVSFEGSLRDGFRAAMLTRLASRVLGEFDRAVVDNEDDHFDWIRSLPWEEWIDPDRTMSVAVSGSHPRLHNTNFLAVLTKDAIADAQRDRFGRRSSVDRHEADVRVFVRTGKESELYLDVGGHALHRRSFRPRVHPASLKETLAASVLAAAQWKGERPLWDPFCGGGTILLEAILVAAKLAPGLSTESLGMERWSMWSKRDQDYAAELRSKLSSQVVSPQVELSASDIDPEAIEITKTNLAAVDNELKKYGVAATPKLFCADFFQTPKQDPNVLVVGNLPYGQRMAGAGIEAQIKAYRAEYPGDYIFLHQRDQRLGKESKRWLVKNGKIDCAISRFASVDVAPVPSENDLG